MVQFLQNPDLSGEQISGIRSQAVRAYEAAKQHFAMICDSASVIRNTKPQIMILSAAKPFVKKACRKHTLASNHRPRCGYLSSLDQKALKGYRSVGGADLHECLAGGSRIPH